MYIHQQCEARVHAVDNIRLYARRRRLRLRANVKRRPQCERNEPNTCAPHVHRPSVVQPPPGCLKIGNLRIRRHSRHTDGVMRRIVKSGCMRFGFCPGAADTSRRMFGSIFGSTCNIVKPQTTFVYADKSLTSSRLFTRLSSARGRDRHTTPTLLFDPHSSRIARYTVMDKCIVINVLAECIVLNLRHVCCFEAPTLP
jgi:hypothetical protein